MLFTFTECKNPWSAWGQKGLQPWVDLLDSGDGIKQIHGVHAGSIEVVRMARYFWADEDATRDLGNDRDQFLVDVNFSPVVTQWQKYLEGGITAAPAPSSSSR